MYIQYLSRNNVIIIIIIIDCYFITSCKLEALELFALLDIFTKLCVLICHYFVILFRYFIFDFDAPPNTVKLILTRIRSNKDVIRASLTHVDMV